MTPGNVLNSPQATSSAWATHAKFHGKAHRVLDKGRVLRFTSAPAASVYIQNNRQLSPQRQRRGLISNVPGFIRVGEIAEIGLGIIHFGQDIQKNGGSSGLDAAAGSLVRSRDEILVAVTKTGTCENRRAVRGKHSEPITVTLVAELPGGGE